MQGLSVEEWPFAANDANFSSTCKRCIVHLEFHPAAAYPEQVRLSLGVTVQSLIQ